MNTFFDWIAGRTQPTATQGSLFDKPEHYQALGDSDELGELPEVPAHLKGYLLGDWLDVSSSNVAAIRYVKQTKSLFVRYLNGDGWRYWPYTPKEAFDFATAPSQGTWVWDNIKVRGKGNSGRHQRSAEQVE